MNLDSYEELQGIIVDNGSEFLRVGYMGNDCHSSVEYNVIGEPKYSLPGSSSSKGLYVCDDAFSGRGFLSLIHPIQRGKIVKWDIMEQIWRYSLYGRGASPEEKAIELIISSSNTQKDKAKAMEIMFESFKISSLSITSDLFCSLLNYGRTEGTVLCSGYGVTSVASFYDGYLIPNSLYINNYGGYDITEYFKKLIQENYSTLSTYNDYCLYEQIKTYWNYTALDYDKENLKPLSDIEKIYELPDGQEITIGRQRYQCSECVFRPDFLNIESPGFHELIYNSISSCDHVAQKGLYGNVCLSGGNTKFGDIQNRLEKEIVGLSGGNYDVKICAQMERKSASWIGGSIWASLSSFQDFIVTKSYYEEYGSLQSVKTKFIF
ncbi:Actin-18 [Entamoeba marina]